MRGIRQTSFDGSAKEIKRYSLDTFKQLWTLTFPLKKERSKILHTR